MKLSFFTFLIIATVNIQFLYAQPGANDPAFNPADIGYGYGDGTNGIVRTTVIQGDGKIILAGDFTNYGIGRNHIVRINADGTIDFTFSPGTGTDFEIYSMVLQSNGKIIIGGYFTSYNGVLQNYIARLNADGSLDAGFNTGVGPDDAVLSMVLQSDGKIIIGGSFTSYNGISKNYIARLNTDGTLDAAFNTGAGANGAVNAIVLQNNGEIIIGGVFTSYNTVAQNYISRLHADGTLDAAFNTGAGASGFIFSTALQSDGKIIIGGQFSSYNGVLRKYIARLNTDGTLDTDFDPGNVAATITIYSVAIQNDGKIIIGGGVRRYSVLGENFISRLNIDGTTDAGFTRTTDKGITYSINLQGNGKIIIGGTFHLYNGTTQNNICRLNTNGSLDTGFNKGTGVTAFNTGLGQSWIGSIAIQGDGKMIIGGKFSSYNGIARNSIARINTDGTLDAAFNPGTFADTWFGIRTINVQGDGKIIFSGSEGNVQRCNADGTKDVAFFELQGTDYGGVYTTSLQADGKIIAGGFFSNYNGYARNAIARLNTDGTVDAGFDPATSLGYENESAVYGTNIQSDGKIIIIGGFLYNSAIGKRIARINTNGTVDATFNPGNGPDSIIWVSAVQSDGKIIIGGDFTSINGITKNHIARLNSDGSLDAGFNTGTGADGQVLSIVCQSDGKMIIGGSFTSYNEISRNGIARLNTDGSLDANFNPGTGAVMGISAIALQSDDKIIIGGGFTSYNGTGRNRIARLLNSGKAFLCPGANSSFTSNITGATYQWQVGMGGNFVNISNNANYSGTSTVTLQISNTASSFAVNHYRCVVDNTKMSNIFYLQFANYWTGAVNNLWENPANWSCGTVPDGNTDVIINTGAVTINSNAGCRAIKVSPGAAVSVTSGFNLTVTH